MNTIATKSKALGKKRPPGYLQGREHERAAICAELERWARAHDTGGFANEASAMRRMIVRIEAGNHL